MIEFLTNLDTTVFLALNGMHLPWLDPVMWSLTGKFTWVPLYMLLTWGLYRKFQWRTATIYFVAVILTVVITDQVCGGALRASIGRLRPANLANPISSLVHVVNDYRGGNYGFPSCHASNSFGLAVIMCLIMRRRWFTWSLLAWAALNSYTRIYLGVHYPGDVLIGACVGSLTGWLMYLCASYLMRRFPSLTLNHPNPQGQG